MSPKWGAGNKCPACDKTVYPNEQIFCQDRKPFHRACIKCGVRGCSNQLRAGGVHRHDNINVCDRCHIEQYGPAKVYGPPDGKESIEEKRIRREREKREYEKGLAEFDAKRNEEVFQQQASQTHLKIAGLMSVATVKEFHLNEEILNEITRGKL